MSPLGFSLLHEQMLKTAWSIDWLCQGATPSLELPASYSILQLKLPERPPCLTTSYSTSPHVLNNTVQTHHHR